ncbi:MAG: DUF350 domain-containing protein [Planctomycetota bacterium]|jgi:uncharacterized membrane protein YjfL (UPF0719 family)|nr:DUF350 domain-containing protein [Planctomycetota bacterium]
MRIRPIRHPFILALTLLVTSSASSAWASTSLTVAAATWEFSELLKGMVNATIYSLLGMVILIIGFKVLDRVTPFSLDHEIAEDQNPAAGLVVAGLLIALGIIVAAAIRG